ncbi:hypothetical protein CRG98_004784 [Punica granatum]|uniref:Uncharacterized protein n=1 Tax=Punica granatum TaxID=22663 RepID=A0A2I0L2H1_PUNGR|nr:hypothetical protein CRG98_004784 [Punica granatum]
MISLVLGLVGSEWCEARTSTFPRLSTERKIPFERVPFPGSGSTRETKMNSRRQFETCSMVLVVLEYVQACFRVPFTCQWIDVPGATLGRRLRMLGVFGRGQRANDVPRSKRVTEMNVTMHKEQSGTGGTQFHSERPNRAKLTLEAPSRQNVRSHDAWRLCAPEFHLVGARMREAYATRLGSIHLPEDAQRTSVRRSCHLLFTTRRSRAVESPGSRGTGYT